MPIPPLGSYDLPVEIQHAWLLPPRMVVSLMDCTQAEPEYSGPAHWASHEVFLVERRSNGIVLSIRNDLTGEDGQRLAKEVRELLGLQHESHERFSHRLVYLRADPANDQPECAGVERSWFLIYTDFDHPRDSLRDF